MTERGTAFVTGASRGIGKAIAVSLARSGFDVAITARSVDPGESREHSPTVKVSDTSPLPGSLRETAELIEQEGRTALMVPADLLDEASLGAAATAVLERWGVVDVVVHNGRFVGPGNWDSFMDTPVRVIRDHMQGGFFAPLVLNKYLIPPMIENGGGLILDITSAAGFADPPRPAGQGGWGISYGAMKAALQRVAGLLSQELAPHRIRVINIDPGGIVTDRVVKDRAIYGLEASGEPPEVVGAVVAWLATHPEASEFTGQTVFAQEFCHEHGLLPGWPGPRRGFSGQPDRAAAQVAEIAARYASR